MGARAVSTRLRSEKGAFVRSPLGAFETASAVTPDGVISLQRALAGADVIGTSPSPSVCFVQNQASAIYSRDRFSFSFDGQPGWTLDQMAYGTYTGIPSGTVWRAFDEWPLGLYCTYTNDENRVYTGGSFQDLLGDGTQLAYNYFWEIQRERFGTTAYVVVGYVNTSLFPGSVFPEGFTGDTGFSFTPGTPP